MRSIVVVMFNIAYDELLQLCNRIWAFQILPFPLKASKKSFNVGVISYSSLTVHADLDGFISLNTVNIGFCCELGCLDRSYAEFGIAVTVVATTDGQIGSVCLQKTD